MARRFFILIVLFSALFTLPSCSTSQKDAFHGEGEGDVYSAYDPAEDEAPEETEQMYGPKPVHQSPVVIVLGPGQARSYAGAGVLKALKEAKIPVGGIVATGMGALIGSLYANSETINQFEWSLLKIKPSYFQKSGIGRFIGAMGGMNDGKKIETTLSHIFKNRSIEDLKIPFRLGAFSEDTDSFVLIDEGRLTGAVRGALAEPDVLTSSRWKGERVHSSSMVRPYLVDEAREMGIGPVIVVDVMDPKYQYSAKRNENQFLKKMGLAWKRSHDERDQADLVISPDMRGIGYFDFSKKTSAEYRGRMVVQKLLPRIKELVGVGPAERSGEVTSETID